MTSTQHCDKCHKSALSLLVLRPSPVSDAVGMAPAGTTAIKSDAALMQGLLPSRPPTESRFVARLLREGYLHVYVHSQPADVPSWQVYRITEDADLIPESSSFFEAKTACVRCINANHNPMGQKLLTIARAHKVTEVWLAYSANLWSDSLRLQNAANPQAMQRILLKGGNANTFSPTEENLKLKVLECGLARWEVESTGIEQFKFTSLCAHASFLAADLTRAATNHPKTAGRELAVVLRDPVGIAAELNAIRIRRHGLFLKEIAKPEIAHPLNSSKTVLGMRASLVDLNALASFDKVSPLRTEDNFSKEDFPSGAEWHPLSKEEKAVRASGVSDSTKMRDYRAFRRGVDMGRIIYEDQEIREAEWIKQQTAAMWAKLERYYDEDSRVAWQENFDAQMALRHFAPLEKYEIDWRAAADDAQTLEYFTTHFDPNDPNDPLKHHSPGETYAKESGHINEPAPYTKAKALDMYLTMLDKDISDASAILLRALVCNQSSFFSEFHKQLTRDPGDDGMRDKTFDFLKDIDTLKKYSWYRDGIAFFGVGQLTALTAALFAAAGRSDLVQWAGGRVQRLWAIQQAIEHVRTAAVHGGAKGIAPKVTVLISKKVCAAAALAILRSPSGAAAGVTRTQVKNRTRNGQKILLTVLTDTDALRDAGGSTYDVAGRATPGAVKMGAMAAAGLESAMSEEKFLELYRAEASKMTIAVGAIRRSLASPAGRGISAITMTLDGKLALGTIAVQMIGIYNSLNSIKNARDAQRIRAAWFGMFDSAAGLLGGLLQMCAVAVEATILLQAGAAAAEKSRYLALLRFGASITGAAGGALNAVALWINHKEEKNLANNDAAKLYALSSVMFMGTSLTASLLGAGGLARRAVAGGTTNVIARALAARGANMVLVTVGATALSSTGVGFVLLGIGIAAQIGAIALTPDEIERWLSRSYFGKDREIFGIWGGEKRRDRFPHGNWAAELAGLSEAMAKSRNDQQSHPPKSTDNENAT